jgi:hypothetical protein
MLRTAASLLSRTYPKTSSLRASLLVSSTAGIVWWTHHQFHSITTLEKGKEDTPQAPTPDEEKKESDLFFDALNRSKKELDDFWSKVVSSDPLNNMSSESDDKKPEQDTREKENGGGFGDIAKNLMSLMTGSGTKEAAIEDLTANVRQSTEQGDVEDTTTFVEILAVLDQYKDTMGAVSAFPTSKSISWPRHHISIVSFPLNPNAGGRKIRWRLRFFKGFAHRTFLLLRVGRRTKESELAAPRAPVLLRSRH